MSDGSHPRPESNGGSPKGLADHIPALKQYTFLALALVGCAMLLLERDANALRPTPEFVQVAVHPEACSRSVTAQPGVLLQSVSMSRASMFRFRVEELHARVRASLARLQAEECCWLNSLGKKVAEKPSGSVSPAWRDLHYDAQQLAKMLGFCKLEPV